MFPPFFYKFRTTKENNMAILPCRKEKKSKGFKIIILYGIIVIGD